MKKYLTESEHVALRSQIEAGDANLVVPRDVARQFFTHVSNDSVQSTLGESIRLKKLVIYFGIFVPVALLLATLAMIVYLFGWGATFGAPLVGAFWTIVAGLAGDRGSWIHDAVALGTCLALATVLPDEYSLPLLTLTGSLVLYRLNYQLAQAWIERLVVRSFVAYDMLVEHIRVKNVRVTDAAAV